MSSARKRSSKKRQTRKAAAAPPVTSSKRAYWHIPAGLLILLLVGAASGLIMRWQQSRKSDKAAIPLPDLSTSDAHAINVIARLHRKVEEQPQSAEAWGAYGSMLMARQWPGEALECFERAAELDPRDMRWPYLAGVLLELGQPAQAVTWYEKAKQVDPDYAPLHARLGSVLERLGRIDEAEAALSTAEKREPPPDPVLEAISKLVENERLSPTQ